MLTFTDTIDTLVDFFRTCILVDTVVLPINPTLSDKPSTKCKKWQNVNKIGSTQFVFSFCPNFVLRMLFIGREKFNTAVIYEKKYGIASVLCVIYIMYTSGLCVVSDLVLHCLPLTLLRVFR